ncbi:MAG: HAMP domain-containing histidine kinase [Nitrospirae bacterium]|nr:HAMP domain-containing histidine kinase [Nitrospirota bacterium]
MFGSLYKKKNNIEINIETTTPESNFTTIGFPNDFKQVILNLINNSRDAIVSRVESSGKKFTGDINIELSHSYNKIYVTIRDNGGGIPEAVIDKIYEPYVSTKSEEKGTGLGLYMSKTIIETNMGGSLTVKNVDDGAEFLIRLDGIGDGNRIS